MATEQKVTPRDLPTELLVITNGTTLIDVYNTDTGQNEKITIDNLFKGVGGGAELEVSNTNVTFPQLIMGTKTDNDNIRFTAPWGQKPKQSTSLSIALPSVAILFSNGATVAMTVSHTIASVVVKGNNVQFNYSETNIASGFALSTPIFFRWAGLGGTMTLG